MKSFKPVVRIFIIGFFISLALPFVSLHAEEQPFSNTVIHHDLRVVLYPQEHRFTAEDTVTVPETFPREFPFLIHKGLNPSSKAKNVRITKETKRVTRSSLESYRVILPQGMKSFVLSFGGIIDHPLEQVGKEQARGYSQTMGKISREGVYLSGHSHWYPVFETSFLTFSLSVELPREWDAVSQGERTLHQKDNQKTRVRWTSPEPQEEIYLVAGKFSEYGKKIAAIQAMVFLRSPDEVLAGKYLEATAQYIPLYETLIGPYPYKKFALVENFWETGFGMPSFTLLGPKVIRFPFIITTSYPHEILHTWWGNSVYPDYAEGNWSEGLTAYLSDHLNAEQRGEGRDYRQTTLQKYTDYVSGAKDFPLTEFRSRHSSSSEAIGYGKSLMFFHMLRLELGDEIFIKGLREFYRQNRFRSASFQDIRKSFEYVSGKNLGSLFTQWIKLTGAPAVKIHDLHVHTENNAYVLTATVEQIQGDDPYHFLLPVAVTMEGQEQAYQTPLRIDQKRVGVRLELQARPLRIDFDPEYDIFRKLDRNEIPPAITQVLGSKELLIILPSSAKPSLLEAYRSFAEVLRKSGPDQVQIKLDQEITLLPSDRAVCIFGRENRVLKRILNELSRYSVRVDQKTTHIVNSEIPFENHSIALTVRNPENQDAALLFIGSDNPEALKGLSRKLPHYHKYSYLAFRGDEPENILKGRWPVTDSPLTYFLSGENRAPLKIEMGRLDARKPLAAVSPDFSARVMMETVRFLSSDDLRGRALGSQELDRAAEYIAQRFRDAGLKPLGASGEGYFQKWETDDHTGQHRMLKNIVGVIPGRKPEWSLQSIIVGAHYDHIGSSVSQDGREEIYHGADDNASGVAVVTELARVLNRKLTPDRNIVFVAFTGEEEGRKGSQYYLAHQNQYPKDQVMAMLNIDTVGRLGNNKLLILGSGSAKEWEHILRGAGHAAGVEVQMVPDELDSSDQKSFQEAGIPAVQFFSGPHIDYHRSADTADKIDADGLVKVALVAEQAIKHLANRQEPLTSTLTSEQNLGSEPKRERKVSFGIIPDFGYQGSGCRVAGIIQDSPAEKAGLKEGDIIIGMNAQIVHKLKDLSEILKALNTGDKVRISYLREGREMNAHAELHGRQ